MTDLYKGLEAVQTLTPPPVAPKAPAGLYDGLEVVNKYQPAQREAKGLMEHIEAGWQSSAPGLMWRGKLPELVMNPETASWWERAATGFTSVGAEIPLMIPGAMVGGPTGAAIGGAITGPAAPIGVVAGGIMGTGAGMLIVPGGIRESLTQSYLAGEAKDAADWWNIVRETAKAIVKEGAIGAATFSAGSLAARGIGKAIAPGVGTTMSASTATKVITTTEVAAQIATIGSMPAALEGRMPKFQEFLDAAILIGGMSAAGPIASRMMNTYRRTGKTPAEQVADAQADPKVAEELATPEVDVPRGADGRIVMPTIQEALFREQARLSALEEKASGTPTRTVTDDFGELVTIEGRPAEQMTPAERTELAALRARIQALEGMNRALDPVTPEEPTFTPDQAAQARVLATERSAALAARTDALTDAERAERVFLTTATPEALAKHFKLEPAGYSRKAAEDSAQVVHDDVLRQLRDADEARKTSGLQPLGEDHAVAVAALVRARVRTRAARLGKLPEEIYNEQPLQIRDETAAEVAAAEAAIPKDAPRFEVPEVDLFGDPIEPQVTPRFAVENLATAEIPLANLVLSKEVPQFKNAADEKGVIVPLGGKFDRTGVGPIQVWERLDGTLEVISGRHRLDLARRSGEETIPAQVHREADGFTAREAATLDAQLNIREEQGSVADYAQYFKDSGITKEAADERGLLARAKGRTGFAIARDGSPDLVAAHRAGLLSDEAALSISTTAPQSERLQALGIAMVNEGKSILYAVNMMKALDLMAADRMAKGAQGDIFGFDDSAMQEASRMSKRAVSLQTKIAQQISAVSGASRRPELAKKMGVDVADPEGIQKKIVELRHEQTLLDNWPLHPELVARLRGPEVTGREGDLKQGPVDEKSPEFRAWFGDSKVVDAEGRPLRVFHGTQADFDTFDQDRPRSVSSEDQGYFFINDPKAASAHAMFNWGRDNPAPNVMPVYLRITNPVIVTNQREPAMWYDLYGAKIAEKAIKDGHDGMIIGDDIKLYVAFGARQIKSATGNRGTFDPNDPNILHQEPFDLKPETPAELAARNAEAIAQAKRKMAEEEVTAKRGRELTPEERKAQFDLFEQQRTLFQATRRAQFDTPAFKRWFGESKVVDENGSPLTVFHGTARPDRIGTRFRKDRATSGPMAFFTDDPAIASNYAKGKPDTSLDGNESAYENYFLYVPKGARAQRSIIQKWWEMTPEQRANFNEIMPRLRENEETGKLEDGGAEGGMAGPGTYEMYLREGRGNGIKAAIDLWLSSGAMFDREEGFLNVMKMAGVDMKGVEYIPQGRSMDAVYPVHLAISNPLDTGAIQPEVVSAIEAAAKKSRPSRALGSGDPWDKRQRFTPSEWVDTLKEDIANGKNSFVWTSIPDWVTRTLQDMGFDGIRDTGGKMGGEGHDVWVPFNETQVKSAIGNRGTFDPAKPNILQQEARASYNIAQKLITTLQKADKSSIVHELGHDWMEEMKLDASRADAPAQIKADWDLLRKEFAIPEEGDIPRGAHEQAARSFERYLAEGTAPSAELRGVFARFKQWMLEIYESLGNLRATVNPELKAIFDRMLATDAEIADAQALGVPRAYVAEAKVQEARKIVPGFKAEQVALEPYADELPKGPGEAPSDSHVNYATIDGPTRIKLTLQRLAEIDQQNIQKHRGGKDGVETWEQEQAATERWILDTLGGGEDKLRLIRSGDQNDPKTNHMLRAKKQLMIGAGHASEKMRDTILQKGHNATIEEQLQYLSSIELLRQVHAEFLGERAAVARAMNALKDTTEGSAAINSMLEAIGRGQDSNTMFQSAAEKAMADQAMLKARLDEILMRYNGKSVLDIAKLHKEIGTLKGTFKLAETIEKATTWEMIVEGWKSSLLSGPVTHTTNLFGTGAFQALRAPVDALAAVIGMARGASPGMGESDRASMSEALARVTGMLGGVGEGLRLAKATFDMDDPTGKVETYRQAIPGRAGELIRIPLRMMGAEDALIKTMYMRGELATLAIRQAFDEGMNPSTREFAERVTHLKDNPTPEMQAIADDAGTRMTFNMPLGEKGVYLQLFVNKWNLQWMLPFVRTPINIMKEVGRMTPFAPVVGEWRAAIAKGGVERDKAIAEMALGSGIMALTMAYVFSGDVSGGGDADPGKNRGKAGVWQPYSIKIGNTWYEYTRIEPTGTLMGMAADMATVWDHMNEEEKDKLPKLLSRAFANAVTNKTFLQGITNVVNAMSDPGRFAPSFLKQMAGSLVPNVIGQPTTMADPVVREVNSMLEAIQARIPGLRQDLIPKRDWLGEEMPSRERVAVIAPVRKLEISDDKVRTEAARLDISISAPPRKTHIGKGTGKLGDVELTPEERDKFAQTKGEMAHKILANIVQSPGYDQIPDLIKRKIFSKVLTASSRVAAVAALPMDKRIAHLQSISERVAQELTAE